MRRLHLVKPRARGGPGRVRTLIAAGFGLLLAGCLGAGIGDDARGETTESTYRGVVLEEPLERPDFILLDTEGRPFDFLSETEGYLTLLFFGFTHCPDICPVHLANLAAVLDRLRWEERSRAKVIFVTVDPDRDSPERIRGWLDAFDRTFVGLRGEIAEVNAIMNGLGLPPAVFDPPGPNGDYAVGHASQILAFEPDGPARVIYPFGTRQADWAHDLPLLVRTESPLRVAGAVIAEPVLGARTALYAAIENRSSRTDALVSASAAVAGRAELHRQVERAGAMRMEHVESIPVPARGRARLVPGGYHIMLLDLEERLAAGDSVEVELVFREAGPRRIVAEVRPYAELDALLTEEASAPGEGRR